MSKLYRFDPSTYTGLDKLGRIPLSRHFHMREFLYSEIAVQYGLRNVPDNVDQAVASGEQLCQLLLEPLQDAFGRVHIRSGYRSTAVNAAGVGKHQCAIDNAGAHTWDVKSTTGHGFGAMACVSIPSVSERILAGKVDASAIGWWIHDHLPAWSMLEFFAASTVNFANEVVFNVGWHERPMKRFLNRRGGPLNLHEHIPPIDERQRLSALLFDPALRISGANA